MLRSRGLDGREREDDWVDEPLVRAARATRLGVGCYLMIDRDAALIVSPT
jgi:hypothetical protein